MDYKSQDVQTDYVLEALYRTFPRCFSHTYKQPLKLDILHDLIDYYQDHVFITKDALEAAIYRYIQDIDYLIQVKAGTSRITLQGLPWGQVSQNEAQHAQLTRHRLISNLQPS